MIIKKIINLLELIEKNLNIKKDYYKFFIDENKKFIFKYTVYNSSLKPFTIITFNFFDKRNQNKNIRFYKNINNDLEMIIEYKFGNHKLTNDKIKDYLINEFPKNNFSFYQLEKLIELCTLRLL